MVWIQQKNWSGEEFSGHILFDPKLTWPRNLLSIASLFSSRTSVSESPALDDSSGYPSVPQYPKDVHIHQVNEYCNFLLQVLRDSCYSNIFVQKSITICLIQVNDVQAGPAHINLCICLAYSGRDNPLGKLQILVLTFKVICFTPFLLRWFDFFFWFAFNECVL